MSDSLEGQTEFASTLEDVMTMLDKEVHLSRVHAYSLTAFSNETDWS